MSPTKMNVKLLSAKSGFSLLDQGSMKILCFVQAPHWQGKSGESFRLLTQSRIKNRYATVETEVMYGTQDIGELASVCCSTSDIAFKLFNDKFLFCDNRFYEISDGDDAGNFAAFEHG